MGRLENLRRIADPAGDSVRQSIRAYHASPRSFDRFDFNKHIGTGEGSQAFGHGGYFASNPKVMQYYYDNFRVAAPGKRADFHPDLIEYAEQTLARKGSVEEAVAELMADYRYISQESSHEAQKYMDMADYLRGLSPQKPTRYEVDLNVPESSLLDWDAPISLQPKNVQKIFGDMAQDMPGDGGRVYRDIVTRHGEVFDDDMTGMMAAREASRELLAEGIPGIRYLDEFSRGDGYGTRNYVMFPGTEDQIRILRKYGLLPATFAAEGLLNPQQPAESTAPAF